VPGRFNLAILHTALDGHAGHAPYAPCSLDELRNAGHDYWVLGHVHEASVLSEFKYVVYPGNSQGRHLRETGAKGAMLVRVEGGQVINIEHRACDEARWAYGAIDTGLCRHERDLHAQDHRLVHHPKLAHPRPGTTAGPRYGSPTRRAGRHGSLILNCSLAGSLGDSLQNQGVRRILQ
jgi:DNA repair exonuclease SbcCD nuclease subunit